MGQVFILKAYPARYMRAKKSLEPLFRFEGRTHKRNYVCIGWPHSSDENNASMKENDSF